jgi:hypothetical protein
LVSRTGFASYETATMGLVDEAPDAGRILRLR